MCIGVIWGRESDYRNVKEQLLLAFDVVACEKCEKCEKHSCNHTSTAVVLHFHLSAQQQEKQARAGQDVAVLLAQ
jgi:hypothetical protein